MVGEIVDEALSYAVTTDGHALVIDDASVEKLTASLAKRAGSTRLLGAVASLLDLARSLDDGGHTQAVVAIVRVVVSAKDALVALGQIAADVVQRVDSAQRRVAVPDHGLQQPALVQKKAADSTIPPDVSDADLADTLDLIK